MCSRCIATHINPNPGHGCAHVRKRALRVGVTGGMASGKSHVCRLLEEKGYPVYWADIRAKALMAENPEIAGKLKAAFGMEAFCADGSLNRVQLAELVFGNPQKLQQLNNIVHPAVAADYEAWAEHHDQTSEHAALFKETALLFEASIEHQSDAILLVYAPKTLRLARAAHRDGILPERALKRMANQWPDAPKMLACDYVVFNDGVQPIGPQVDAALAFFPTFNFSKQKP